MSLSLRRKLSGAPTPNTLKKHPSTTARKSTSSHYNEHSEQDQYDHQPWATAHLLPHRNSNLENSTGLETQYPDKIISQPTPTATMSTNRKSNRSSATPAKTYHHPDESTDQITPLPPTTARQSTRSSYNQTPSPNPYTTSPETGHSNVSLPARPPRKHAYSECFDLIDQNQIRSPSGSLLSEIRSPSGNLLSAQQAAARSDRPKGMLERQEAIRKRLRERREMEEWSERARVKERERAGEREERERDRVMAETGLGNWAQVVGGGKARGDAAEVKAKADAKGKGKGKRGSFCGCL